MSTMIKNSLLDNFFRRKHFKNLVVEALGRKNFKYNSNEFIRNGKDLYTLFELAVNTECEEDVKNRDFNFSIDFFSKSEN